MASELNSAELISANLILPLIKDLVQPKISSWINKYIGDKIPEKKVIENFEEYLSKRYEKFTVIDTLVFPNKQVLFDLIYEPLTLIVEQNSAITIEVLIDHYPEKLLPAYNRVIVEDTAGMGKSTIIKKLFKCSIEQKTGIPILIELRQINSNNNFIEEILNQLSPIGQVFNKDNLLTLLNLGEFIFLLDGFDEIPNDNREFVITELHRFIEKANNNYFLMTSRPEDTLKSFGDFMTFRIKNLEWEQSHSLIRKYDHYSYKPIAEELISQLNAKTNDALDEFLQNPLLTSLIYKSFDYKKDIPLKKTQFYKQVFDALYESHDLSKEGYLKREKFSKLHIDDFERVLRYIAFLGAKENKIEYDSNSAIFLIDKAKEYTTDLNFKASDFLKDLLETVPLFKRDGNYIKWSHKSLQDFFAAKFLWIDARDSQDKVLSKVYSDNENARFYNLLDLYYELDAKNFEKSILYWLLKDFKKYSEEVKSSLKTIPSELIEERISYTFCNQYIFVCGETQEFDVKSSKINEIHKARISNFIQGFSLDWYNINYFYGKNGFMLFTYVGIKENIDTIMGLVSDKLPKIIARVEHDHNLNEKPPLEMDREYLLRLDSNDILNNPRWFKFITSLTVHKYKVNYNNALKKLVEIETKLLNNLDGDLLNW